MAEQTLIIAWFFLLGSTIGSFMNVVIYRLPLGMNLSRPSSHCPLCGHPIRWFDNVPVFGWLWLGGKCRDCHAPISPRYPIVEAWVGANFASLAAVEIFRLGGGGASLVESPLHVFPLHGLKLAALTCLIHAFLLCTFFCAAAIEESGKKIPARLFFPALAVGLLGFTVSPQWLPAPIAIGFPFVSTALNARLAGLVVASAVGGLLALIERKREKNFDSSAALSVFCLGLVFGWQAALVVPAAAFVTAGAAKAIGLRRVPAAAVSTWFYLFALAWTLFGCVL